jgi:hypothetical protein
MSDKIQFALDALAAAIPEGWRIRGEIQFEHEFGIVGFDAAKDCWYGIGQNDHDRRRVTGQTPTHIMSRLDEYGSSRDDRLPDGSSFWRED